MVRQSMRDTFDVPMAVARYAGVHGRWPTQPDDLRGVEGFDGRPFDPDRYDIVLRPRDNGEIDVLSSPRKRAWPAGVTAMRLGGTPQEPTVQPFDPSSGD